MRYVVVENHHGVLLREKIALQRRLAALTRALIDVEGTLLGYWTDIPEAEVQRLTVAIRAALGADAQEQGEAGKP